MSYSLVLKGNSENWDVLLINLQDFNQDIAEVLNFMKIQLYKLKLLRQICWIEVIWSNFWGSVIVQIKDWYKLSP